jgi:hypothetical protein
MMFAPPEGWRHVEVTGQRSASDAAAKCGLPPQTHASVPKAAPIY